MTNEKVKITKELFVETINKIQKGHEQIKEFEGAMSKVSDSFFITNLGREWLAATINLLCDAVGDENIAGCGTMIEWFLYESVEKEITITENSKFNPSNKEIKIDVSTPELLYDYFVNYN